MMQTDATNDVKLLPGEEMVNVLEFAEPKRAPLPSVIAEMEKLAGVHEGIEIGAFGPVNASRSLPDHNDRTFQRYETLFGRDSLRVALNLLSKYPRLARTTLLVLAQLQGVITNDASEEEPGRIVHEVRDPSTDPIAQDYMREHGWQWPYYGSVDATPEYIRLLSAYCLQSDEGAAFLQTEFVGRDARSHKIAYSLTQATRWIVARLDANTEGLLEFKRRNARGIENQAWKDSWDSYFHANGTMANHTAGIASIEVQRVAYDALLDAADLYERFLNKLDESGQLRERAELLRQQIMDRFWTDQKGGYFVLGTDRTDSGNLRKLAVRTSNMGHLLHSRLLMGDDHDIVRRREAVIWQLFSADMLCVNGIRTLATDEVRFRPGAYHNGSCWGWDNYIIAQGLEQLGYVALADNIEQRILDGVTAAGRYVEFLRGDNDKEHRVNRRIIDVWDANNEHMNRIEQPPQDMQAWTVAAVYGIKLDRERRLYSRIATDAQKHKFELRILHALPERLPLLVR